ncbi:MAG: hypothetical protein IJT54_04185 [Candidatus Methanomethylophilaceae archaeon]|nr:hypothetical protein [Candidatus Methanomethylophilaceae archaeon]
MTRHLKYSEFEKAMFDHNRRLEDEGKDPRSSSNAITGVIVFCPSVFEQDNGDLARSFRVGSNNKAWISRMSGYSIFADCLDKRFDCGYRIEDICSNDNVEYCYIEDEEVS